MSGGVSDTKIGKDYFVMFSPRERGCFQITGNRRRHAHDLPARAGCFLLASDPHADLVDLPARVGVFPI